MHDRQQVRSLQLHIVFMKEGLPDYAAARRDPNGITVMSRLFKVSQLLNPNVQHFVNVLPSILCGGRETTFTGSASLLSYLPKELGMFYRYRGSFTSPPCAQTVTWIVFAKLGYVTRGQMRAFRQLRDESCTQRVKCNLRNIQPRNGRLVERAFS